MMKVILLLTLLSSSLLQSRLYSLRITEVFYKGNSIIKSEERYIEIFNDSASIVPLAAISLKVPVSKGQTALIGVKPGDFTTDLPFVRDNCAYLPVSNTLVILSEGYSSGARMLAFASNTLLVCPSSGLFTEGNWSDRLSSIQLFLNGELQFDCSDYTFPSDTAVAPGESLSLWAEAFIASKSSPGFADKGWLYSAQSIVKPGSLARIDLMTTENESQIIIGSLRSLHSGWNTTIQFMKKATGQYSADIVIPQGLTHGENVIIEAGKNRLLLRYQEINPRSDYYQRILINEIVTDPQLDYSGGHWSGSDGGGLVDSTDDWLELVNRGKYDYSTSNCFVIIETENGETIKTLSERTNSRIGLNKAFLPAEGYSIVTLEGGIPDNCKVTLWDNHPQRNGKFLDSVSLGVWDKSCADNWGHAPAGKSTSKGDEALARRPNGVSGKSDKNLWFKQTATFLSGNSVNKPDLSLEVSDNRSKIRVYLAEPDKKRSYKEVLLMNQLDKEVLALTDEGLYYTGEISLVNVLTPAMNGVLSTQNGLKTTVFYNGSPEYTVSAEAYWADKSWVLPEEKGDLSTVLVYPNPVKAGEPVTLYFSDLAEHTEVRLLDNTGNVLWKGKSQNQALLEWNTSLTAGIYFAVFNDGGRKCTRKLLVY